jgi:hypothetical protein
VAVAVKLAILPFDIVVFAGVIAMLLGVSAPVLFSEFPPPLPHPTSNAAVKTNKLTPSLLGDMQIRFLIEHTMRTSQ